MVDVINSLSDTLVNVLMTMMLGWHTVHFILVTTNVQWRSAFSLLILYTPCLEKRCHYVFASNFAKC